MTLMEDSCMHSSNINDFATFLDAVLDYASDVSCDLDREGEEVEEEKGQDEDEDDIDSSRTNKRKVDLIEAAIDLQNSASNGEQKEILGASLALDVCAHPGVIGGMCIRCGKIVEHESGVAFGYIHKDLWLSDDEIARLRDKHLKNLICQKKLVLILDLDHTLLNSIRLADISCAESYLMEQREILPYALRSNLFKLDWIQMMTKLRPFVHTFLKEASSLFEMYIYTMGERAYALDMANLLDPGGIYFPSRVIA